MNVLKLIGHLTIVVLLTILTQVGGLIWLLSSLVCHKTKSRKRFVFPLLYALSNLIILPLLAPQFGRVPLPYSSDNLQTKHWLYPLAFRNYVTPELKALLIKASKESNIKITYLDANFPFCDGFPLLPHLSHNDGKKIDLSFMYLDENEKPTQEKPSTSGYGIYVKDDTKISSHCLNQGYWQYDFPKHLTFGSNNDLKFDTFQTKRLIQSLLKQPKTQKLFIEPYLKTKLGLQNENKIRFHGCQAVRHDDHIHLQIK